MSEEFIVDPNQFEKQPEINNDENLSETPKKRITRRRLKQKNPVTGVPSSKTTGKKRMTEVLTNLYNDDEAATNLQEISMKKTGAFQKFTLLLLIGIFITALIWAGFFFAPGKNNTTDGSQVNLTINGPTELSLGATSTYLISYENTSNVSLKKTVLNTYFPEGFVYLSSSVPADNSGHNEWNLGTIAPYQKGAVSITGLTYGSLNDQKSWRVFLNYLPTNFNSELQKAATLTTVITAAPIKLTISGPDQVSVGADVSYTFNVQINPAWSNAMVVAPEVPSNFTITSSSPAFTKNNQWVIPESTSTANNTPTTFTITGNYTDNGNSQAPMKGVIVMPAMNLPTGQASGQNYQIGLAQLTSTLIKNDVGINLAINGAALDFDSRPGDTLNITVRVKNQSAKPITNAIVKLNLTAPANNNQSLLNWSALADKNQNIVAGEQIDDNTRRGIISWNSAQIPALAKLKPNDEVTIDIQLPIKDGKKFDLSAIKSPVINADAEVKFKDAAKTTQEVSTRIINMTLNSDLTFTSDDSVAKAGEIGENHTINWVINNSFHALKNVAITATAFGDVSFLGISKAAGDMTYDPILNKITWSIAEIPTETDVLNSSFSLTINKTNPTQSLLLSKAHLTAEDTVTGKTIDLAAEEISLNQ